MWVTSPGTLRPLNSFSFLLNLEKDLSPEQLVTIKLRNKGPRGWINKNSLNQNMRPQRAFVIFFVSPKGGSGGAIGAIAPPNFFHHNIVQFRKQHSRYKAIFSFIVLSQNCCEVYFILFTVAKPLWDLATKYYWNRPPKLTGWIRPWCYPFLCLFVVEFCGCHLAKWLLLGIQAH